ncbi:zinc finger BED domain-containing protein RICESLEEPER 2-like protein [Tanacetum coccineum]
MASQSATDSATTGVGSTSALGIREIIPTNRTPEVWKDFNMCIMTNGQKKAQCKYCFHFFSEGSNTTLKNHITHPHCEVLKAQQNQNPEAGQTSMGRDGQIFMYNPDYLREQFAGLVIQRGLPFNHFDHEQTTRVFQNTMQPRYTHVSRSTLKRDAMKLWVAAKQATIDGFANLNNKVNLTTDIWSAPHNLPGSYMCVTAHWIEPSTWQMMKRVISFEEFSSVHSGTNLKYMLEKVFVMYGLKEKIMSITLDNASNNTSAMDKLKLKYDPPMGGRFYHSRCVAHIINLVVQAGLKVPIINQMKESFKQMLKDVFKSGDKIRKRYIKVSALNPCFNVSGVDYLIENISRDLEFEDDGFATRSLDWFHESFQGLYNMYYSKYGTNQTQSTSGGGSSSGVTRDPYARLLHGLTQHKKKKSRGDPTMSSEYEQYLKTDFVLGLQPKDFASYDVLGFWKSKENQFPVLSRMAMDILSVQASSVASESAFSTSGKLLTIRRTRLTPESLEMCMCLKDHLDAQERKQNTSPLELPLDVEEGVFNDEVQQNEATQLTDQEIALDASSDGSLSSGERRRDYMMSSGAEDDQTGEGGSMSHGYTYY